MLAAGLVALVVTACGPSDAATPTPSSEIADCGTEESVHGQGLDRAARQCLLDAFLAGETAVLVAHSVTMEGDPIITTFRTHGSVPVEVIHDARQDAFGSGEIELIACERLVPVAERNDGTPEDYVFVQDGCEQVGTR